jgi:hypothetical protein
VSQERSRFRRDTERLSQIAYANPVVAKRDQINRLQPYMQRQVTSLENGANSHRKGFAALVAFVSSLASAFSCHLAYAARTAAVRTYNPLRPDLLLHKSESCFLIPEARVLDRGHVPFVTGSQERTPSIAQSTYSLGDAGRPKVHLLLIAHRICSRPL